MRRKISGDYLERTQGSISKCEILVASLQQFFLLFQLIGCSGLISPTGEGKKQFFNKSSDMFLEESSNQHMKKQFFDIFFFKPEELLDGISREFLGASHGGFFG